MLNAATNWINFGEKVFIEWPSFQNVVAQKGSMLLAQIDYEALEALGNISPDDASSVAETGVTPIAGIFIRRNN